MRAANATDFYKVGHVRQYPDGTSMVVANWTARKSRIPGVDKVVFFGLQAALQKMQQRWQETFFGIPQDIAINNYKRRIENALPGSGTTYDHLRKLWVRGYLPIEVWALPEGTAVPIGVPMFVMWNTCPEDFWLTNYLETSLSADLWGPCTSATIAQVYRKILMEAAERTGGDPAFVDWQGHDFSYRGMYGSEAAAMSGAGHLLSFAGTDTIPAIDFAEDYYGGPVIAGSVPATEHSVMCAGTQEAEIDTFRRLLKLYPTGVLSIVSDTWDYWKVLTEILPALKDEIMARDGKVVVRPDSGDPVEIICGTGLEDLPEVFRDDPEQKGSFRVLWDIFGGKKNSFGFKELDPHIGLIYGDSITMDRCKEICFRLQKQGFVPNMVFGIGSYTYQFQTRDTFGFAIKATYCEVNGQPREIWKDPKTDSGEKKSARGLLAVTHDLKLKQGVTWGEVKNCAFQQAFLNGALMRREPFQTVAERVRR